MSLLLDQRITLVVQTLSQFQASSAFTQAFAHDLCEMTYLDLSHIRVPGKILYSGSLARPPIANLASQYSPIASVALYLQVSPTWNGLIQRPTRSSTPLSKQISGCEIA